MKKWFAAYVNSRHEKKVVLKLNQIGLEAYTPISKKLQTWSDRKKWVEFPMISGYVFVKANLQFDKEKILGLPSVFGFVKFGGEEAEVKEEEILVLKSIEETGYDITQEKETFVLADRVQITQGPLKGIIGTVIKIQDEDYVCIELASIKQNLKIKVPKHILKH